ncbi:MAG: ATP-binding cassette domain-containing protein [Rhodobacteraceae bacterium]|jgi:ATP-binding cassette subfamily C protein CydC|nr:ATP-binding cassette domain-containing protein [Paracoccaceae bacterium]
MRAIWRVFAHILAQERVALIRGALLSLAVLAAGAALLGLAGWFIVAAAAAGAAGAGLVFDVFRPSAGVRFLALGRTAARYGERLLTHDATLRALAALRVHLLERLAAAPFARLERVRGGLALNALTADVDALDGVPLRLILPLAAGLATQLLAAAMVAWLVDPGVALWVLGVYLLGGGAVLGLGARASAAPSRRAERALQALRARTVDLLRARGDFAVAGRLTDQAAHVLAADARRRTDRARLDAIERAVGLVLTALTPIAMGGALVLGMAGVAAGTIGPAAVAMATLVALALAETVQPLRRAMADLGRMADAARRVAPDLAAAPAGLAIAPAAPVPVPGAGLLAQGLTYRREGAARAVIAGLDLAVAPGETLALTGPSGAGKSTTLALLAGLIPASGGRIAIAGHALAQWPESALRAHLALLLQRSALIRGTVRQNLALAAPEADDATLQRALDHAALWQAVAPRGGLDLMLGDRGAGLSGGEARRLAVARVLLRKPLILLLDEPTEGLDGPTADRVLAGIRAALPEAAIVVAAHRPRERAWADRVLALASAQTGTPEIYTARAGF